MSNQEVVGGRFVVIVLGRPAAGKTTISAEIAERLRLPIVAKDAVKELLFDTLGMRDREWSKTVGRAAFALLDYVIELQLRTGRPFLIDAAYDASYENAKFQAWQETYRFSAIQVHCTASTDELVRRFTRRAHDGTRHAGHADREAVDEFQRTLSDRRTETLDLHGSVLQYNSELENVGTELFRQLDQVLPPVR